MTHTHFDALVIGGGIVGRCALYHLQRLGLSRVGLVERFGFDHRRGSSHSHSRITRSAYVHADYVRLMQVAHSQEWPRLEADAGERLILPADGCFFGPAEGKFEEYERAATEAGVDPSIMGIGPVPAVRQMLDGLDMEIGDIDLIELNEAFAVQVLAVRDELGIDLSKTNVNGGAIALGHPIGCTGARIVVTLIHALQQHSARIGLATLCVSGGMGTSLLLERV